MVMVFMRPIQQLTGRTFGRWIVIQQDLSRTVRGAAWICRCICGKEKSVKTRMLTSGQSQSCGCLHRERVSVPNMRQRIHGEGYRKTPEYRCYAHIKNRCRNTRDPKYSDYGGRGIKVCQRWLDSYLNFLADMKRKPSSQHSIHR